jgi:hypothetical protein
MLRTCRSSLAELSATNRIQAGHLLIVFRTYFDGSGKEHDPASKFVSLVGIAAEEEDWALFDEAWRAVLEDRGNPGYMQMVEAMRLEEAFDGWTEGKVDRLVEGVIGVLQQLQKDRFRVFRCSIEIEPWTRWTKTFGLKRIPRTCAKWTFRHACMWYASFPHRAILQKIDAFYDQNEEFLRYIHDDWTSKKKNLNEPWWNLVSTVAPADSRLVPSLQAADAIAWSHNRLLSDVRDARMDQIARDVSSALPSLDVVMNEAAILTVYGRVKTPDPGLVWP